MSKNVRIGVFICHCGKNIAGTIDIEDVRKYAEKLPNVIVARDYMFMCSEAGQQLIKDAIKEYDLNRIIVAACSPKLHEITFRRCLEEAGLNKFFLEMANIREQCSWVHINEPHKATEKAKALIRAAVMRVHEHEEIGTIREDVVRKVLVIGGGIAGIQASLGLARSHEGRLRSVLVIGGGIAGIQASLDLADMGYKVYLVEKRSVIGGNMAKTYKTFPTDDCAMCILSPKMNDVAAHKNIELITNAEVVSVDGEAGHFKVKIRKHPKYVDPAKCTACGTCAEKCPGRAPDDWNLFGMRKAIYLPYPQGVPRKYVIDPKACLYLTKGICRVCEKICPAGAINFEDKGEEVEVEVGAIIVATGWEEFNPEPLTQYGYGKYKNVITLIQFTRMFDVAGPTGGKVVRLSDGKPANRILIVNCVGSRDDRYIPYCSTVCCMAAIRNARIVKFEQNPNAEVYICYIDIRASGKGYEEYYKSAQGMGINFIRGRVAEVYEDEKTGDVIARVEDTTTRTILELRVDLLVLACPMVPSKGTREIANLLKLETDEFGFIKPRHHKLAPVDTSRPGIFACGCATGPRDIPDTVASASAAALRAAMFLEGEPFEVYLVEKSPYLGGVTFKLARTFFTDEPLPDILTPLFKELSGNTNIHLLLNSEVKEVKGHIGNFTVKILQRPRYVDVTKCNGCGLCKDVCPVKVDDEWNLGLTKRSAIFKPHPDAYPIAYAIDPHNCKFTSCAKCVEVCPTKAIVLSEEPREIELKVGAIIVATGLDEFKPLEIKHYGYGVYKDVITQLQLARMLDPKGPTGGKLVRPSTGEVPRSVVMIQCAGSRDEKTNPYCSRICCAVALKAAKMIKEQIPGCDIYICYVDMSAFGFLELYYKNVQSMGVNFIRGKVAEVLSEGERLKVRVEDTLLGELIDVPADLVVLSSALIPAEGTSDFAKVLGIDVGPDGFLKELHLKLRPVDSKVAGIFIAGGSQGPKDIADTVAQALAASSKAAIPIARGFIEVELVKAQVDEGLCVGCGHCEKVCPYKAIEIVNISRGRKIAKVHEVECEGCGACAATCRLGAIQLRGFKDNQILAQLVGLLGGG
ncbi:MAG: CoB--CoM heterodisulfide reductase iron-sulfur subunit A family protein [Candidatus Nezhaarchaeota archaeon]|nr:CoB--CoM heterodisulfide reductase iron-sulfur subunit A family protein [Candidatus Nezhaarchaeota archaeon]